MVVNIPRMVVKTTATVARMADFLAVIRLRPQPADPVQPALRTVIEALDAQSGFVSATIGRAADDPGLWVLVLSWADIGSYRRALSAYDVKVAFGPVQGWIVDEPTAYEVVLPTT
jgi:quinol monooxygenase YgiN